jgi:phosphomannomutase
MNFSRATGYEANDGFLLGSNVGKADRCLAALPTRDAVLPMLALLCMAREKSCKLSELPSSLPQLYTASLRLQNFPTKTSSGLITQLHEDLPRAVSLLAPDAGKILHVDTTDGLRLTFTNGCIVHLRPSDNAPELRCYAEAETQAMAENLCRSVLARVSETTQAIV